MGARGGRGGGGGGERGGGGGGGKEREGFGKRDGEKENVVENIMTDGEKEKPLIPGFMKAVF